jgi:hypothetical protein
MTLVTRDPATGLRRNGIRWPDGTAQPPFGCRWCGEERRCHGLHHVPGAGLHEWARPTDAQVLARMKARRRRRAINRQREQVWKAFSVASGAYSRTAPS